MKIPDWLSYDEQICQIGDSTWSVARLSQLARTLPVMRVPLDHLNVYYMYDALTLRELVMHMQAAERADLNCPIILDEDNNVMDGRHRIMKALLLGEQTIKAVRFDENPEPCSTE